MKARTLFVTGLVAALLIAGVVSFYASSNPDGLEFVAEETGFLEAAEDPKTAGSPFADYQTEGVGNERLGGAIAGVTGVTIVLVLMGGLAYAVRRRGSPETLDR